MNSIKLRILLTGILLILVCFSPAAAVTLTVGADSGDVGETLTVPITVDNPEGIAGAAFTVVYSSALSVSISSDFFDTFYSQFNPLATTDTPNPDGGDYGNSVFQILDDFGNPTGEEINIPAVVNSVDYYQPLITNSVSSGMMLSAARCVPGAAGGPAVLFSLNVQLNNGEPAGTYSIQIIPTELNNPDAGYSAGGETIDLLIGSDPGQPLTSPDAFPVILDDDDPNLDDKVVAGQVVFAAAIDSDSDGLPDDIEGICGTDPNDADTDDDGIPDGVEDANKNGTVDPGETDPCDIDSDGDLIQDGTELGYTSGTADTDLGVFQPDLDGTTTTDPLDADTDNDGINDGQEDLNRNGRVDAGETNPRAWEDKAMPWIPLLLLND